MPAEYNESVVRLAIESVSTVSQEERAIHAGIVTPPAVRGADAWIDAELNDWRTSSVATQRTYATTMLTTSSGAVAVYFAVLKYLGWEAAKFGTGVVILTVAPPVLLFGAAAAFALALRPSLTVIDREGYAKFRAQRLDQMHQRSTIGTMLYASALALSIIVFILILEGVS